MINKIQKNNKRTHRTDESRKMGELKIKALKDKQILQPDLKARVKGLFLGLKVTTITINNSGSWVAAHHKIYFD